MSQDIESPGQGTDEGSAPVQGRAADWRDKLRQRALASALRKRAAEVPSLTVPEASALLSVSQEFLYRLIQADGFPAVHMGLPGAQGRYVVPAKAVEMLLRLATDTGSCVESAEFAEQWRKGTVAGAV